MSDHQITVSFTVDTDQALMLVTLHNLLTKSDELPDSLVFLLSTLMDKIGLGLHELWPEIYGWAEPKPWVEDMLEAWYHYHASLRREWGEGENTTCKALSR